VTIDPRDVAAADAHLRGLDDVQIRLVRTVDDAAELFRWLSTHHEIAIDTETTGLSPERDRVRLVQYGDELTGWVVPFERWGGIVEDVTRRFEGRYTAHNAPYDVAMLDHEGIHLPRPKIHDTRIMAHVLDSRGSLALKKLSKLHVDPRADAGQHLLDDAIGGRGGWTWATVPIEFEPYWVYAGLDTILTSRLRGKLEPLVQLEAPRSYELELAVTWVCNKMERHGTRVDREYTQEFVDQLSHYATQVRDWCHAQYGCAPGSPEPVVQALLRDGVELTKRTDGGKYSLDKYVLRELDHPLAQAVLGHRQAQKLVGTYLMNYLRLSEHDGYIHPHINSIGGRAKNPYEPGGSQGVRTGRMSMDDPNLQNVPIRTKEGERIRNCFIPSEGHVWVKTDADQIESRIMAHLSQDPGMIAAFKSDGDFFVNLARNLFAEPDFQKSDPRRQMVKNGMYAKIYSAGIHQFSVTAGVPDDVGGAFIQRLDALYPGIPTFSNQIYRLALQRRDQKGEAYVRSFLTGRKHVADPGREYAVLNYEVQGAAGELLKMKMLEADAAGLGEFMTIPVHDEIDFDVPRDQLSDALDTIKDVMDDDTLLSVPLTWSTSTGERWGDLT
jgi:DNA polymerase-1